MEIKKNKVHVLPSVIIFIAVVVFVYFLFTKAAGTMDTDGGKTLQTALSNSAVLCYALEGFYPPTLDYLEENYGVIVDEDQYIIDYEVFASNVMPEIKVMVK